MEVRSGSYPGNQYTVKYEFNSTPGGTKATMATGTINIIADDPDSVPEEAYRLLGVPNWVSQDPLVRISTTGTLAGYDACFTGKLPTAQCNMVTITDISRKGVENSQAVVATRLITTRPNAPGSPGVHYYLANIASDSQSDWRFRYFNLNWSAPTGGDPAAYYIIYRSDPTSTNPTPTIQVGISTDTNMTVEDISTPGVYRFSIQAYNHGGDSDTVTSASVTVPESHYTILGIQYELTSADPNNVYTVYFFFDREFQFEPSTILLPANTGSTYYDNTTSGPRLRCADFEIRGSSSGLITYHYPEPVEPSYSDTTPNSPKGGFFIYKLTFNGPANTNRAPIPLTAGVTYAGSFTADGYVISGNGTRWSNKADWGQSSVSDQSLFLCWSFLDSTYQKTSHATGVAWGNGIISGSDYTISSDWDVQYSSVWYPKFNNNASSFTEVSIYLGFDGFKFGVTAGSNNVIGYAITYHYRGLSDTTISWWLTVVPDADKDEDMDVKYNGKWYCWSNNGTSVPESRLNLDHVYSNNFDGPASINDSLWLRINVPTSSTLITTPLYATVSLFGATNRLSPVATKQFTIAFQKDATIWSPS